MKEHIFRVNIQIHTHQEKNMSNDLTQIYMKISQLKIKLIKIIPINK